MAARYVSATGTATGTGSLTDPMALTAATLNAGGEYALLPGRYAAPAGSKIATRLALRAADAGVIIEPDQRALKWNETEPGSGVWAATFAAPHAARQAVWFDAAGVSHRIPLWNTGGPGLTSVQAWIDTVRAGILGPKWGATSTLNTLYLIPPPTWPGMPSIRMVAATELAGLTITGTGVEIHGITFIGHQRAIQLTGSAQFATIADCTFRNCGSGVHDVGTISPVTYGYGHTTSRCTFEDDGAFAWFAVKSVIRSAECVGYSTEGGSTNSTVEDCTFQGTFDGISQYHDDARYGFGANRGLLVQRCSFRDIHDDAIDLSRWNDEVVFADCDFRNVGTIISPAPLWGGRITLRRCTGSRIGEQVRYPDSTGKRPAGSVIKVGAVAENRPPGTVRLERCEFWTDTLTSQGISQDGGVGTKGPRIEIVDSTIRTPNIVVNWPYDTSGLVIERSQIACSGKRPLKPTTLPVAFTPAAVVDGVRLARLNLEDAVIREQMAEIH